MEHYPEIIDNVVKKILENEKEKLTFTPNVNTEIINEIREKIYKNFIIYVDANDNGIDKIDNVNISFLPSTLWARVAKMNPMWWETSSN